MKYLVMECHPAYAVVLDEAGNFHKVANMDYEVGQTVTAVVFAKQPGRRIALRPWLRPLTMVACVCLVLLLGVQYLLTPWGTVRLSINPDILLTVNRLDRVIAAEGLNADGVRLLDGYNPFMKSIKQVLRELTALAAGEGMLSQEDTIRLTLPDQPRHYSESDLLNLAAELEVDTHGLYRITTTEASADADPTTGTDPTPSTVPKPSETTGPTDPDPTDPRPTEEDDDEDDEDDPDDDDPDDDDDEDDEDDDDTP